jgi:hypothetical protein
VLGNIANFLRIASLGKSCDKNSPRATEREIDGIVHRLLSLTPAEIALIEGAVGTKPADLSMNSK